MTLHDLRPVSAFDENALLAEIVAWVEYETPSERTDLIEHLLDHVQRLFAGLPIDAKRIPPRGGRGGQLILEYNPSGSDAAPLVFMGHVDTVWAAGTLAERPVRREGDKVFGPGIFDMKAGSCLSALTLRTLAQERLVPPRPVVVYLNGDEEIGSLASKDTILALGSRSAAVVVPEPSFEAPGTVITARKGWATFRLEAEGVAAHAGGSLKEGRSAIMEIVRQALVIEEMNNSEPQATFNIGVIGGGTRTNVVPAQAWADVDMRADTIEVAERLTAAILARKPSDSAITLTVTGGINRPPFPRSPAVSAFYEETKALAEHLGLPLGETSRGGVSDGNFVAALGKPVIDGMGCSGAGAHALHEHILVSTVATRAALMFNMAMCPFRSI